MAASCLNCGAALVFGQSRIGKFLECPACNSRLVGFYLLHRLLPPASADSLWITAHQTSGNGLRPCPLCSHGMAGTSLPDDPVVLDLCTRCHMVWFDSGEFDEEPFKAPPTDPVLKLSLDERKQFAS